MLASSRRYRIVAFAAVFAACGDDGAPEDAAHPRAIEFSTARLLDHAAVLAQDSMCGRPAGSVYERRAAAYVESIFASAELTPAGPDGYLQGVSISGLPLPQPTSAGGCGSAATATSQNVLGALPGSGALEGQWVIVGAHYDHVGWRDVGGAAEVYNGADDNASGTALLLETARLLTRWVSAHPEEAAVRRSIMFQAYGAEEMGMLGSTRFAFDPTVPLDSIVAMLNLDMVGRLRDGTVELNGTATSPMWPRLLEAARPAGLTTVDPNGPLDRSDHYGFHLQGIPVLHCFTGLHQEYHTTADDVDLLNLDGLRTVGGFLMTLLWAVATEPDLR
jgi:hypothetical protein